MIMVTLIITTSYINFYLFSIAKNSAVFLGLIIATMIIKYVYILFQQRICCVSWYDNSYNDNKICYFFYFDKESAVFLSMIINIW